MEVILLQDVKTLGKKGDRVTINDGYARNYVLPKKLAIEATARNLNDLKLQKANEDKIAAQKLEEAKQLAIKIEEKPVVISVKTGEGGKIFGSVSTKEIATACAKQLGFEVDKKKMVLPEPIKACGTVIVPIKVHKEVTAKLSVKVQEA